MITTVEELRAAVQSKQRLMEDPVQEGVSILSTLFLEMNWTPEFTRLVMLNLMTKMAYTEIIVEESRRSDLQ